MVKDIGTRLAASQRVLIASHVRPDGDAVGSLLGLGLALKSSGKAVQMVLSDGLPSSFRHLVGSDEVKTTGRGRLRYVRDGRLRRLQTHGQGAGCNAAARR